jgi:hypothetical protein
MIGRRDDHGAVMIGAVMIGAVMITKDSYTYSIKILRQDKTIRDHGDDGRLRRDSGDFRDACARCGCDG